MTERDALRQEVLQLCRRPALNSLEEAVRDQAERFGSIENAQIASQFGVTSYNEFANVDDLIDWLEARYGSAQEAIKGLREGRLVLLNEHRRTWLEESFKEQPAGAGR